MTRVELRRLGERVERREAELHALRVALTRLSSGSTYLQIAQSMRAGRA